MLLRNYTVLLLLISLTPISADLAWPQATQEEFRVYTEYPRLFLRARRLRLLRRECERQSIRFQQFEMLMAGKARMAEPGFALALFSQATGDRSYCVKAIEWALGPGSDLRQLALVYDWCREALDESQSRSLETKIQRGMERAQGAAGISAMRDRVLAAVALADTLPEVSERELRLAVQKWWRGEIAPALKDGRPAVTREDMYALFEIFHAIRDNLYIDLRESVPRFFKELPNYRILSYYPSPYPAPENAYRIPAMKGRAEPDLKRAMLSRAAEFAMVAYDPNALENQFLQGWLIHDLFLMRNPFGNPYEFLWANPYLPGLSYYHLPLAYHDEVFGRLFLRSSWEDDATWLGCFDGEVQVFEKGELKAAGRQLLSKPVKIGDSLVFYARNPLRFDLDVPDVNVVFLVGLTPRQRYEIEIDDEEMTEQAADPGGILALRVSTRPGLGLRMRPVALPTSASR